MYTRGDRIGRYIVVDTIGAGAMGTVYAAYDPELTRTIALKVVLPQAARRLGERGTRMRLLREAQAMARVNHPNVVDVFDVGHHGVELYLAMERIDGTNLRRHLARHKPALREILAILLAAGRGLAAAHREGLVHRDFKPENVLVGERGRVCVSDFGLARPDDSVDPAASSSMSGVLGITLTHDGDRIGTPAYMAPEQHRGVAGPRSDQFAFCVVLYESLYGRRPFGAAELGSPLGGEASSSPPLRSLPRKTAAVPRWLRRILRRGLAPDPAERFASMNALLDELQRYAGRRRRWTVRSGIAALLVGAAGVGLVAAASKSPDDPCTPNVPDDAWAPTARARVDAALDDASRPTVLSALDAHVARWRVVQHDLCATTWLRGERSPEALGAKLRCLHASWADLRQSVVLLSSGGVPRPVDVVEGVAAPETCRAVEVEPGGAPVDTQRFGELVDVVARAGALRRAGRPADAVVELRARVHEIRELGSAALLAEALLGLGRLEDDRDTARHLLDEALALARRSGHVRIEAETWIALATVAAHPEHARFCAQMGLAALTTVGNDPALEAEALGILEGL